MAVNSHPDTRVHHSPVPLQVILDECLSAHVARQSQLACRALVNIFLGPLRLERHLAAMRALFLGEQVQTQSISGRATVQSVQSVAKF